MKAREEADTFLHRYFATQLRSAVSRQSYPRCEEGEERAGGVGGCIRYVQYIYLYGARGRSDDV